MGIGATRKKGHASQSTGNRSALSCSSQGFAKSISNLLDNAVFAEPTSDSLEIEVAESRTQLFVAVMDRGPGWPTDLKAQGIRPHFTTRPGGTGLGLFNCQSLCEVMGGSLELLDRKGGGAIAKLALPKTA
ncbi:MAG: ATP-binding protein [Proteobacteria bacterium]|nr:ATP-binding protein [Pseudomonadota bacterium]